MLLAYHSRAQLHSVLDSLPEGMRLPVMVLVLAGPGLAGKAGMDAVRTELESLCLPPTYSAGGRDVSSKILDMRVRGQGGGIEAEG